MQTQTPVHKPPDKMQPITMYTKYVSVVELGKRAAVVVVVTETEILIII